MIDEFLYESNRLKSFTIFDWPLKRNMHAKGLAKAGFYYYGDADRVQCAFCNGILGEWEADDLPMYQHRKFFPNCPFLNNPYGCGNVALIDRQTKQNQLALPAPSADATKKTSADKKHRVLTFLLPDDQADCGQSPQRFSYRPAHPDMTSYEKRLKTFQKQQKFPIVTMTKLPAEHLAEAGFFYSGTSDVVCCFFCNGTLSRWLPSDDAWAEHAKWYPRCLHLLMIKGSEYVNSLTHRWSRPPSTLSTLSSDEFTENKVAHLYNYEGGKVTRASQL